MPTDIKLDQGDGNWVLVEGTVLKTTAADLMLDAPQRRLPGGPFAFLCLSGGLRPRPRQHIQGAGGQTQQQVSQGPAKIEQAARHIQIVELSVVVDCIGNSNHRKGQEQQLNDRAQCAYVVAHCQ